MVFLDNGKGFQFNGQWENFQFTVSTQLALGNQLQQPTHFTAMGMEDLKNLVQRTFNGAHSETQQVSRSEKPNFPNFRAE